VVAFSAIVDPSFLLPTDFLMGERELSNLDLAQRTFARKNYTADQLVEIDKKYRADTKKWMKAQGGTLTLVVPRAVGACILHPISVEELPQWVQAGR
jgi:hypothetical protein